MLDTLAALAIAAAAASAPAKPVLALMGLTPGGGVEPAVADALSEAVAAEAARAGYFQVTSQKDMQTLLPKGSWCSASMASSIG